MKKEVLMQSLTSEQQKLFNTLCEKASRDKANLAYLPSSVDTTEDTVVLLKNLGVITDFHKHSDGRQRFSVTESALKVQSLGDGSTL